MKKIIIVLFLLVAALTISFLTPVTERESSIIAAHVIAISQQLNNAASWKKWNPDLKLDSERNPANYKVAHDYKKNSFNIHTSRQSIQVLSSSSSHFEITILKDGKASLYNITLAAGKDINSTAVTTEKRVSLISSIFSSKKNEIPGASFINNLKSFMETDSLYYGFNISIQPVVDSNIVVYRKQVPSAEKFIVLPAMYKILQDFIAINHLKIMQPPMLLFTSLPKDSSNVVAMLAVNKTVAKNNLVHCMKMPLKGRMLVGRFRGKYRDCDKLQIAMQQYCLDKNIESIVNSYEKFTDNKVPQNQEALVEMEIHFPIL